MIAGIFRLGRTAARAGQPGQRQGPPKPYGPVGTILSLLVIAGIIKAYPLIALSVIGAGVIAVVIAAGRKPLPRERGSDELDEIMRKWGEK